jgi:hypothetical protein
MASDGSVVRKVAYDAYGAETQVGGSFDLPIGYAGGLRDGATGFVRFGLRDYDPARRAAGAPSASTPRAACRSAAARTTSRCPAPGSRASSG